NDEQVIATNAGTTVDEGSTGNVVTSAMLQTTDVDNTNSQLVYTVTALPNNGTLRLSGSVRNLGDTFTQADIDAGLITYDHDDSQTSSDSFAFTIDDGTGTTSSGTFNFTITNVNDAPVAANIEAAPLTYTENDGAVAITSSINFTDVDDTHIESAIVQFTGGYNAVEDTLSFINQNGITGTYNATNGTWTLTGSATLAQYEAAIRSITYANSSEHPDTTTRTISFTVNDGDANSNTLARDITITRVNDAPIAVADLATAVEAGGVTNGTSGTNPTGNVLTNDTDVDTGDTKTVTGVSAGVQPLGVSPASSPVTGTFGSITISADGNYTYTVDENNPTVQALRTASDTLTDVFTYTMQDAAGLTSTTQITITIQGANDAPVVAAIEAVPLAYTENDGAIAISTTLSVLDVDDANIASATVQITGNYVNGQDLLSFVDQNGITGVWNATTGALTLSGSASKADYEAALRSITYTNSSENPTTATRTVSFTVSDGDLSNSVATRDIVITSVNDAPLIDNSANLTLNTIDEDAIHNTGQTVASILASDSSTPISDPDGPASLQGIAITATDSGNGTWQYSIDGGSNWINIGMVAEDNALLLRDSDLVRFVPNALNGTTANFTFRAWDQTSGPVGTKVDTTINGGTSPFSVASDVASIVVTDVNDAPVLDNAATMTLSPVGKDDFDNSGTTIGQIIASAGGNRITDVDSDAVSGIAIFGLTSVNGFWEYSLNGGTNWLSVGSVSNSQSLLLQSSDLLRFVPNGTEGVSETFQFRAWDQSTGTAGDKVDTTTNGGTTAFSTAVESATVWVVDATGGPTAVDDVALTLINTPVTIDVAANDIDLQGNNLFVLDVSNPANGSVSFTGGEVTYTPDAGFTGTDSFTYLITDGNDNLAHYYRLDGNATDQIGGANGTLHNGPTTVEGQFGEALWFDGVNDYVALPDITYTNEFSISFSFKVDNNSGTGLQYFYAHGGSGGTSTTNMVYVALVQDNFATAGQRNHLVTTVRDSNDTSSNSQNFINVSSLINDGQWHNYTLTVTPGVGTRIFLNGVLLGTLDKGGDSMNPVGNAILGARPDLASGRFLKGGLDSLAIYNRALTTDEIQSRLDGTGDVATATVTVNDRPALANPGSTLGYTENQAPTAIAPTLTLTDSNHGSLIGATVQISGNYSQGQDLLAFANQNGISGTWDATTGTLTLSGTATVAQYETALRSVTYENSSDAPSVASRTVTFVADDGLHQSLPATQTIEVSAANDAPVLNNSGNLTLVTIDEDAINNPGQSIASILASDGGTPITDIDGPTSLQGVAITSTDNSNGTWQYSIDGGTNWINVGVVSVDSALLLRDSDWVRFVPNERNGTTANFTFRAWDQTSGAVGTKVDTNVNGATTAFSTATDIASILVTDVNDAPVANTDFAIAVEAGGVNNSGIGAQSVGNVLDNDTDVDAGDTREVIGVSAGVQALAAGPIDTSITGTFGSITIANDGSYTYTIDNDHPTVQSLRTAGDTLTDVFSYTIQDSGGLTSTTQITITIQGANDAPHDITTTGLSIAENGSDGTSVGTVTGMDVDSGDTLTYTLQDDAQGRFTINGSTGQITVTNASLIDYEVAAFHQIIVRVTDLEGTWFEKVKTVNVINTNDAPVIDASATFTLNSINEDDINHSGQTVASIIASGGAGGVTDQDSGSVQGIAITDLDDGNGSWQFSTDGGANWTNVGTVADDDALLLRESDLVRFVPNGETGATADFTFRVWDQTTGIAGTKVDSTINGGSTAFSTATSIAEVIVSDVNDAPVLNNNQPFSMTTITEDDLNNPGQTVADILASNGGNPITDVDGPDSLQGIAIRTTSGSGTWQYSLDDGDNWQNVGNVLNGNALLLKDTDRIRFVPDGENSTAANFTFRAWDQTNATAGSKVNSSSTFNGGTTSLSNSFGTVNLSVTAVNDAPVLDTTGSISLNTITEDNTTNSGQTVASIVGARVTDVDNGAIQGIAITDLNNANSSWQYSTDDGTTWTNIGAVSIDSALLLRDVDLIRFMPNEQNGTTASFTFHAWDQTGSTAGQEGTKVDATIAGNTSPFSAQSMDASISVSFVNDAPTIDGSTFSIGTTDEDNPSTPVTANSLLANANDNDVDLGAAPGIAITVATGSGTWQYTLDGVDWTDFGPVGATNALLLDGSDLIRYVPDAMNGETATLSFRAWDQTFGVASLANVPSYADPDAGGGTTAFSIATSTAELAVTDVNDAPVISVELTDSSSRTSTESNSGLTTSGTLTVTDLDHGDGVTASVTSVAASGTTEGLILDNAALLNLLSVEPNALDGSTQSGQFEWVFDSGSEAFDYLATGESLILTYTIRATDSQSAFDTQNVSITITGTNDAPFITVGTGDSASDTLNVDGTTLTSAGALSVFDLDRSDEVTAAVTEFQKIGDFTGLELSDAQLQALLSIDTNIITNTEQSGTLNWSFDSDGYTFGYLADGQSLTLVYTITVTDSQGDSDTQAITLVISGNNATPEISVGPEDRDSAAVAETDATLTSTGTLSVVDINTTDVVNASVTEIQKSGTTTGLLSNDAALLAMLSINADVINGTTETGTITWTFNSASEAFDYLASGESLTLVYTITATDSQDASDTQNVTITINGTNDEPAISIESGDSAAAT
ncbi:MAG TPA: hypothetical protein DDZ51_15225, partial [Planctomycetaceae bacterium]|nr:hypothetical protein [Planctomycetaceae bacterium]